ncbi:MAG: acyltransferase family protein [Burkholderiales bacterium]
MKSERLEVIDLLKACACILIVWHHLVLYSPMANRVAEWFPLLEAFLLNYALMAVQIFLVVGGYLNAKSWVNAIPKSAFDFFPRLLLRYQRLTIPLLVALSVAVAITALVRPYFDHSSLSNAPSLIQVVAHIFLLQDILDLEAFSAGVWYVAIDFQLFAMAMACASLAQVWQGLSGKGSVVRKAFGFWLILTLCSIFVWNLNPLGEIWGAYFFGAYGLGLCVGAWRFAGFKFSVRNFGLLILIVGVVAMAYHSRSRLLLAIATALLLCWYEANDCNAIQCLQRKWIRELSNASYAIFLIHFSVSLLVSAVVFNFWPENITVNAVGLGVSFGLSIWMGRLIHQAIESPKPNWKRYLQWAATLVATCTGVMLLG